MIPQRPEKPRTCPGSITQETPQTPPPASPASGLRHPASPSASLVDSESQVSAPALAPVLGGIKAKTPRPGWWKVPGMKGTKANIAQAIQGLQDIPPHWQAALQAEIAAHDASKGKLVLHLDISPVDGWTGSEPAVSVSAHFMQQHPKGAGQTLKS